MAKQMLCFQPFVGKTFLQCAVCALQYLECALQCLECAQICVECVQLFEVWSDLC